MGGSEIEVKIVLLHVLAVIALVSSEIKQALLEDGVSPVPEGKGKANQLVPIGEAPDAVLAPAVRAGTGMIVLEIFPRCAVGTVVFSYSAPLALGEILPPPLPVSRTAPGLFEALLFLRHFGLLALKYMLAGITSGRQRRRWYGEPLRKRSANHSIRSLKQITEMCGF
jgi:hypothetical protein